MNQLIRYREASRAETIIHLGLGLAAVAAVVICVSATFRFAAGLEVLAARWSPNHAVAGHAAPGEDPALTNVASGPIRPVEPRVNPATTPTKSDLPTG